MNAPAVPKGQDDTHSSGDLPAMGTPSKQPLGGRGDRGTGPVRGSGGGSSTPSRSVSETAVVGNVAPSAAALLLHRADVAAVDDEGVIAADPESSPSLAEGDDQDNSPQQIPVVESSENSNLVVGSFKSNCAGSSSGSGLSLSSAIKGAIEAGEDENTDTGAGGAEEEDEEDEDESEYEYEDDDDAAFSGFLVQSSSNHGASSVSNNNESSSAVIVEEDASGNVVGMKSVPADSSKDTVAEPAKKKWREPSKAAVNMSLRAEKETSGSKRRLAQDLYRIMNQDTKEAGFSLEPASEDSMELWNIKLFQFDDDSNLAKDMMVLGIENVDLEMKFPEQYPFEPPFVRVVSPRFKRQTGFVMNGALCMELLTKDGWNPINDIESVIVSIRSLLVVGDGRLQAATELSTERYEALLKAAQGKGNDNDDDDDDYDGDSKPKAKKQRTETTTTKPQIGSYSASEAQAAYSHLTDYHKKKGWDQSGWWARKG